MSDKQDFLWVESYRPQTVQETILPDRLKQTFQQFVDQKNVPNLLLSGRAGVGKTTIAKAMLEEIGADYIVINGSMRCSVVEFSIDKADKPAMASQFFKRVCGILNDEGVTFDQKAVAELVQLHFPDWRRVLNELQRYATTGNIDAGILSNKSGENISSLIDLMKNRDFTATRKWVAENVDVDSAVLYRQLYDTLPSRINTTQSVADAIIILADYQYKEAFVANSEINRVAALATLMAEIDWK